MKNAKKSSDHKKTEAFRKLSTTYYRPEPKAEPKETEVLQSKRSFFKWRYAFSLVTLFLLVPLLVIGVWSLRNFAGASDSLFGSSNVLGLLNTKPLANTDGRVNILIVGYSADNPGHNGADLTDSILLMSLDQTDSSKSYMLSVPRDLYVNIDGYGYAKINEAYQAGERQRFTDPVHPVGGMGLLRKTVSDSLGVDVHYHALVNYAAVREIVDALGGVVVTVTSSDERGLYDPNFQPYEGGPLDLPNGTQKVNGETALKLTRARGAAGGSYGFAESDFTRTKNQQIVVSAILNELNWTLVLDPRTNGKIFTATAQNMRTDLELSYLLPLYRLLLRSPTESMKSYTLRDLDGVNYLQSYGTRSGQAALIPRNGIDNFGEIKAAIDAL
jgi:polyisoprenyl-teichoic acid--peptidoglycan teichoic acid transferase